MADGDAVDTGALVHHLAERAAWEAAVADGHYRISTLGMALDEVGFIHCSQRHQVAPVAQRFYVGVDDLVLLTIDPALLDAELRYEPGTGTDELFPHLYGPLNTSAVITVAPYGPVTAGEPDPSA